MPVVVVRDGSLDKSASRADTESKEIGRRCDTSQEVIVVDVDVDVEER